MSVKNKKRSGVTMLELIIAVAVLVFAMAGIATVFHVAFQTSRQSNEITIASIEAQLQMESLIGRTLNGSCGFLLGGIPAVGSVAAGGAVGRNDNGTPDYLGDDAYFGWNVPFQSNGLWVRIVAPLNSPPPALPNRTTASSNPAEYLTIRVTVYVYMNQADATAGTNWVVRHSHLLHVSDIYDF